MIVDNQLKKEISNKVISICKTEIDDNSNKELLGLIIDYFYDGEAIDIGCEIEIFNNNEDEAYTKHISFTINDKEEDNELAVLLKGYNQEARFNAIEEAAKEIKDYLESIDWSCVVKIAEEMFIDLELYD
ncbi:hypothetical protein [Clostridium sp. HMSC19A10]|uniref:hypothetical protein n=1 Tax=Clostridium sp. HMSC19A10 TaxID=1581148 RepID=UPI0008A15B5C|nr:hypothetical protein [Clostridium sp. HMSC19A10]OFS24189.1 hypothetical protein HMPREF3070_05925 [Clostridium sp. HMSC19A10]